MAVTWGYPAVLVRAEALERPLLEELVEDTWRAYALKQHLAAHASHR